MMKKSFPFMRMKPLSKKTTRASANAVVIRNCAMHNLREIPSTGRDHVTGAIRPERSRDNVILAGPRSALEVANFALHLMAAASLTIARKNANMGSEVVFSLEPGSVENPVDYFQACVAWLRAYYDVPVISAVCHFDQAKPHCHVLLLPLRNGKWLGGYLFGKRSALSLAQKTFRQEVATRFGLDCSSVRPKASAKHRGLNEETLIAHTLDQPTQPLDAGVMSALVAPAVFTEKLAASLQQAGGGSAPSPSER